MHLLRQPVTRRLRQLLEVSPPVYQRFQTWRGGNFCPVTATTELVISGFPGSGNSFARAAMLFCNPGADIASHGHTWGEVAEGVRLGRPVVFLTREPTDALVSLAIRYGHGWEPRLALVRYARMHERVADYRRSIVVGTFDEATRGVGALTRRVNERFGTHFVEFDDTNAEQVSAVLAHMEGYDANVLGAEAATRGATPSAARDALKVTLRERLEQPEFRPLLARCERARAALLEASSAPG